MRYHACLPGFAIMGMLAACDPGRSVTVRLSPGPAAAPRDGTLAAALQISGRISERHGLREDLAPSDSGCRGYWSVYHNDGGPSARGVTLWVCVRPRGELIDVVVGEAFTTRLSPKADSVRSAIADSLRPLGEVQVR